MSTEPETTEKRLYEVEIGGIPLKLRSSHDEATVQGLVELVDSKISEAMSGNQNISFQMALLLSALHIAEDLVFLKQAALMQVEGLEHKAKQIFSELESSQITRVGLDQ